MKKILFVLFIINSTQAFSNSIESKKMMSVVEKTLLCRIPLPTKSAEDALKSVECFQKNLSANLTVKEQAGLSSWFYSLKQVDEAKSCDAKAYNIESYSKYTPYFICLDVTDGENKKNTRLVFFTKINEQYKISSIYTPTKWN